jgi:hypothetical protein
MELRPATKDNEMLALAVSDQGPRSPFFGQLRLNQSGLRGSPDSLSCPSPRLPAHRLHQMLKTRLPRATWSSGSQRSRLRRSLPSVPRCAPLQAAVEAYHGHNVCGYADHDIDRLVPASAGFEVDSHKPKLLSIASL